MQLLMQVVARINQHERESLGCGGQGLGSKVNTELAATAVAAAADKGGLWDLLANASGETSVSSIRR